MRGSSPAPRAALRVRATLEGRGARDEGKWGITVQRHLIFLSRDSSYFDPGHFNLIGGTFIFTYPWFFAAKYRFGVTYAWRRPVHTHAHFAPTDYSLPNRLEGELIYYMSQCDQPTLIVSVPKSHRTV